MHYQFVLRDDSATSSVTLKKVVHKRTTKDEQRGAQPRRRDAATERTNVRHSPQPRKLTELHFPQKRRHVSLCVYNAPGD